MNNVSTHCRYLEPAQELEEDDKLHLLPSFTIIYMKKDDDK